MTGRVSLHLSKDGGVIAHSHVVATMGPNGRPFVKLFSINFHLNCPFVWLKPTFYGIDVFLLVWFNEYR